ncbi:hexokinase-2 isoform X4 [Physcomitrium patens]|uniref:Phosphotransferase n=1 Tax=Physcomitrium patens TaxID=3218 RepID=A0A7I4CIL1_PHYPA|nr:hexokinase-2-like isoform X4 [Physcomitrium patens]XP_024362977.1 hexokinase-2-like isoform X4 [Physcomitrium patens]XP_024362978.1 hexokinase-2-like isoform X4 [Physcomitrium patens]XP_024362979.1 hexokinase-2-like isoform X4 [Physcomitrium patens]|eukprot:XP_024362976.1 hexokinase-2-like isoform X4 [Physcomitrella patens]
MKQRGQVVQELFDFIAERLVDFVSREGEGFKTRNGMQQTVREMGLTFSFPVKQQSVKSGAIIQWSKGFDIADGVGADVVALLQSAINRQRGPKIEVAVLVNDTVGTLAGGRYWNEDVMVGMILGTGTNACYVEHDLPSHVQSGSGEMVHPSSLFYTRSITTQLPCVCVSGECVLAFLILSVVADCDRMQIINMEWGGFWSSHLPRTFADEQLDKESLNPGQAGYEKMIGGMYLGEIVRRVLLRMEKEASLFGGPVPSKLKEPFSLITPEIAKMHADESKNLRVVAKVLRDVFGVQKTDLAARRIVHDVCDIVIMRSARLAAAGIVGIFKKIGGEAFDSTDSRTLTNLHWDSQEPQQLDTKRIVVAVDGGLYEHCTQYRVYMRAAVNELLSEAGAKRLQIVLSKDGSGIGASILAARHSQHRGANKITCPMERPSEAAERPSVHLCGGNSSSCSQHTQSELPPRSTQFTQSEPTPRSTQFTQSEPQSNWLQATQHSVSYVYGLEYID